MKNICILLFCLIPYFIFSQSLNENPYLTYYLPPHLQESSLGALSVRNYDGIAKTELAKNIPASWTTQYSLNHLPISARVTDANSPFGRNQIIVSTGEKNKTQLQSLGSHFGEWDTNLKSNYILNKRKKIQTGLLVNYHHFDKKIDKNKDNFLDLPLKKKLLIVNGWSFGKKNIKSSLDTYHLRLNETGGEINFNKDIDHLTTNSYGMGTDLVHTGIGMKNDFIFKNSENEEKGRLFLDTDIRLTNMDQFFGVREYLGDEKIFQAYAGYEFSKILSDYEFGFIYKHIDQKETLGSDISLEQKTTTTGLYGKFATKWGYYLKFQAGLRAYYSQENKFEIHPSFQMTYQPVDDVLITLFSGSGQRQNQVLQQYNRFLFSGKAVNIEETLQPEKAWNYGFSFRYKNWDYFYIGDEEIGDFRYYLLFYHNIYQNFNHIDLDNNQISITNFDDRSYKTSLSQRFSFQPLNKAFFMMMYRFDVFKMENAEGKMFHRHYHPKHHLMMTFSYRLDWFTIKTQYHFAGKTPTPIAAYSEGKSPKRKRWDMQIEAPISKYFNNKKIIKHFSLTLGVDNILNQKIEQYIFNPTEPFSEDMDGGLRNNNVLGTRLFFGTKISF